MSTAMSVALAKAGVVSEEAAEQAQSIPWHLRQFKAEIEEISQLAKQLEAAGHKPGGTTSIVFLLYRAELQTGNYQEAYKLMLDHLRQEVSQLN
jgi:hypothetical protein